MDRSATATGIARGGVADILGLVSDLLVPSVGKGVLRRRPGIVGLLESTGYEDRAIQRLQALRRKYGARPVLISVFGSKQVIVTDPASLQRVLQETPKTFVSTSDEKASALAHFEPGVSLISDGTERRVRRDFNSRLLDEGCPRHGLAAQFGTVVREEVADLVSKIAGDPAAPLTWDDFFPTWNRIVRRVLLGDGARDDETLTEDLEKLRSAGNWGFLHPGRKGLREDFHRRLETHLARADGPSLAGQVARAPDHDAARPSDQFAHYMFAFDPGGMATFRALAVLATHHHAMADVRADMGAGDDPMPRLRAAFLESLRLWPTSPLILRQARNDIAWEGDTIPAGAQIVIYAPFFHRDGETLDEAHRFAPELWPDGRVLRDSRFVPFSDGDGVCPARDLVPMIGAMVLAELLGSHDVRLVDPERLAPDQPLPPTLDNYSLEFSLQRRTEEPAPRPAQGAAAD